jgi:hypothetical protein
MKTFKDLKFETHPNFGYGFDTQATMNFENGYGVSVVTGDAAYSSESQPYEVAILKDDKLCYDTHITNDVLGHNTEESVTHIMEQVQNLESLTD